MSEIAQYAVGHWPRILTTAGIDPVLLDGKHHPCPICGGDNRFRFDNLEGRGTFICQHCQETGAGDGFQMNMRLYVFSPQESKTCKLIA